MYLIIYNTLAHEYPEMINTCSDNRINKLSSCFSDDIDFVNDCLRQEGSVRVFKLDSLTEIKEIEVICKEIPKELRCVNAAEGIAN